MHLPEECYPPKTGTCNSLVVNGNTEQCGGYPFPMKSFIPNKHLYARDDTSSIEGSYFRMENRTQSYSSITFGTLHECLEENAIY